MTRIYKLDGLRGLFSVFIVFFHFDPTLLPAFIGNNFIIRQSESFVDFFFVLSGYLIAVNYESRLSHWESFLVFVKNRWIRIYPLLIFSTLVFLFSLIISNTIFPRLLHNEASVQMLFFQALDTLCLTNSTPLLGDGLGLNFPTWSISSEMISYLIFGGMMVLLPTRFKKAAIFLLIAICFMFLLYQERYFLTGTWGFVRGLLCFNLGYFVYVLAQKDYKVPAFMELVLSVLLLILFYLLHQHNFTVQREMLALVFVPLLFAIFILVLLKSNGLISRMLDTAPFQFVGKISYSIYLNHALIVVVIPRILFDLLMWERTNNHLLWSALLVILVLFTYSIFTYHIIEVKGGKFLKRMLNKTELN